MSVPDGLVAKMWAAAGADAAGHYCAVTQIERAAQVAHDHYIAEIAELVEALTEIVRIRDEASTGVANVIPANIARRALAKHQPAAQMEGL
jgi:hypothetical protein